MDAARRDSDLEALLRESAWVRSLARGLLGEGAAADDLAQDVLVAALDRRPGLEGSRLRGWLRTVARRLAGRSHERRGLRERAERATAPSDDSDSAAGVIGVADRDANRRVELQRELTAALGELEPSDRTVLVLRYFDGLSTGELARQLDHDGSAPRPVDARGARFFAIAEGHGLGAAPAASQQDDIVITLPATRTLTGRMLEDGVAPSEPLRLRLLARSSLTGNSTFSDIDLTEVLRALDLMPEDQVVFTGADGGFSLQGLTVGLYHELQLPGAHLLQSVNGRPQAGIAGRATIAPDSTDVLIETARLPSIVGRVVWEDTGDPLVGTFGAYFRNKRQLNTTQRSGWLDERGCFVLGVPIEPFALEEPFEARGAALTERSVRIAPAEVDARPLPFEHTIDLTLVTFPLDVGTIRVPRAPVMHVRLNGPDGTPIRGAVVGSDLERVITEPKRSRSMGTSFADERSGPRLGDCQRPALRAARLRRRDRHAHVDSRSRCRTDQTLARPARPWSALAERGGTRAVDGRRRLSRREAA